MRIAFLAVVITFILSPAFAQQPLPHPTADQVQIQILENDVHNLRAAVAQLAVEKNDLTAQIAALKTKCGKVCEPEAGK